MKTYREYKQEIDEAAKRSLSRLHGHIEKGKSVAFVSAHRGNLSAADNNKRTKQLHSDLKSHGYTPVPVKGEYIEDHEGRKMKVKEKTFMVHHDDHKKVHTDLKKLGSKHGQDSVLTVSKKHGSNLHGTGSSDWIKKGETMRVGSSKIGNVNKPKEFGTRIGGKDFVFGG
jgi:hypothetical protein|tara:strand:- start:1416 stop:1925 length:510 start_codon:yes stop_codon:yes gene_type:complete